MNHVNFFDINGNLTSTSEIPVVHSEEGKRDNMTGYTTPIIPLRVPIMVMPRQRMMKVTQCFALPIQIETPFYSGNVLFDHERMRLKIEKRRQKKLKKKTALQRACARQELTEHNIPSRLKKKAGKKKVKFSSLDQPESQTPDPALNVEPPGVHLVRNLNAKRVVAPKEKEKN